MTYSVPMLSKNAHPIAVLRKILNLRQKEFASLIGVATVTVQKIEIKKRPLTLDLAKRIEEQTGAQMDWLMSGDPHALPLNRRGVRYRMLDYEKNQADIRASPRIDLHFDMSVEGSAKDILVSSVKNIVAEHLGSARRKGSYAFNMLCFRLEEFLRTQTRLLNLDTHELHEAMIIERNARLVKNRKRPDWIGKVGLNGEIKWLPRTTIPEKKQVPKTRRACRKEK